MQYLCRFTTESENRKHLWAREDITFHVDLLQNVGLIYLKMFQSGILHRDVKPENIIISRRLPFGYTLGPEEKKGEIYVRILDFGYSVWSGNPGKSTNCLQGTKDMLPPEALMPHRHEVGTSAEKSMTWTFGCLLFMFCGLTPFYPFDDLVADEKNVVDGKVNTQRILQGKAQPFRVWLRLLMQDQSLSTVFDRCTLAFLLNDLFLRCTHLSPALRVSLEQFLHHPVFLFLSDQKEEYNTVVTSLLTQCHVHYFGHLVSFCVPQKNEFFPDEFTTTSLTNRMKMRIISAWSRLWANRLRPILARKKAA